MTKLGSFGAAATLCLVLTTRALAQEATRSDPRPSPFTESYNRWDGGVARAGDTAFWPGDVAAGATIGSAGAIATAPSRGDSNAYYNNGDRSWSEGYAHRNGFVCQPGTWFHGQDGRQHICQ